MDGSFSFCFGNASRDLGRMAVASLSRFKHVQWKIEQALEVSRRRWTHTWRCRPVIATVLSYRRRLLQGFVRCLRKHSAAAQPGGSGLYAYFILLIGLSAHFKSMKIGVKLCYC